MYSVPGGHESALARKLLCAAGDAAAGEGRPVWMMVQEMDGRTAGLVVLPDRFDPLGWSAPPGCSALAMVGTGRVRSLDESVEMPAGLASGCAGGARMACVLTRSGSVGWHMVLPDGSSFEHAPEDGLVMDTMRRALGLPTPPPLTPVTVLADYTWLVALLDTPVPRRRLTWSEVLDVHPAVLVIDPAMDVEAKEACIDRVASDASWETLRRVVAGGGGDGCFPPPGLAAWMDEGMFSRWVLGALEPPEVLLARVRGRIQPAAARRLGHRVRAGTVPASIPSSPGGRV